MPPFKRADQAPYDSLWKTSDRLRGSIDASQHKDFVLGLIFLRYLSAAFDERRDQITRETASEPERQLEEPGNYVRAGVHWVPPAARWTYLAEQAQDSKNDVGRLLDNAIKALTHADPSLRGVIPDSVHRGSIDQETVSKLVALLGDTRFTRHDGKSACDLYGEIYEYFLERFAYTEGKRGGEFYTPSSVVKLLVEMLEPYQGRVYDPCCGSGGMLAQAEKFALAHGRRRDDIAVYGQETNQRTWRMAKMNLAVHGINGDLSTGWADTFYEDKHRDLKADHVMASPPFNMSDWSRKLDDPRWRFGTPPAGNSNFAWIQHIISKLSLHGSAGIIMANGSMSSKQSGEGDIRAAIVEADLVACMIALPSQLFHNTVIPTCAWFLAKDKSPQGARALADRRGETLFIDARFLGVLVHHGVRVLTPDDLDRIVGTYHGWRGTGDSPRPGLPYEDVAGFCRSVSLQDIREQGHILTPGRYVGHSDDEETVESQQINERISRLTREFIALLDNASRLESAIRDISCKKNG